ncbi:hypothetical protein B0T16DRAFT_391907 [Cercophora newfieldiana]|uniref:Uncharacterized protein n=1 Tax=Cercophora newfieldiana TaxID=92897 RepID=A0AA39Y0Y6_9PEZI|nr:hypothetical protein B0T16DRAFT_391907 [Cercophora newfieldiana]
MSAHQPSMAKSASKGESGEGGSDFHVLAKKFLACCPALGMKIVGSANKESGEMSAVNGIFDRIPHVLAAANQIRATRQIFLRLMQLRAARGALGWSERATALRGGEEMQGPKQACPTRTTPKVRKRKVYQYFRLDIPRKRTPGPDPALLLFGCDGS